MANIGKKVSNTTVVEGVGWDDRYNITGSQRDKLINTVRLAGSDVTGSQYERTIVWTTNIAGNAVSSFDSASYGTQFPSGTIVFDLSKKCIMMKTDNANTWYYFTSSAGPV